jgi:hypothetical protein
MRTGEDYKEPHTENPIYGSGPDQLEALATGEVGRAKPDPTITS